MHFMIDYFHNLKITLVLLQMRHTTPAAPDASTLSSGEANALRLAIKERDERLRFLETECVRFPSFVDFIDTLFAF